jgi:hypothetical protein
MNYRTCSACHRNRIHRINYLGVGVVIGMVLAVVIVVLVWMYA